MVSNFVLASCVPSTHDLIDITNTACIDIIFYFAVLNVERIENSANRVTSVLDITELVDFQAMMARLDSIEFTSHLDQVARLL